MIVLALVAASAPAPIREYVRADPDGSEAETILVYRPAPDRVEVVKHRARCTDAAYVVARVDRRRRSTVALSAGRLLPEAQRREVGTLARDGEGRLAVLLGDTTERLAIGAGAWHLYDFDLADLSALLDGGTPDRRSIRFRLAMAWNGGDPPLLRDLSAVTLRFRRAERFAGRAALRYEASGVGHAFVVGPLWRDARDGAVLGARWGTPNHAEYRRFDLRQVAVHRGGAQV